MNADAFKTLGKRIAGLVFDRRSKGRKHRTTEAHVGEEELGLLLALAVEEGYQRGLAEGRGQPHPVGVMTARGRLVALPGPTNGGARAPSGPSPSDVAAALRALNGRVLADPEIGSVRISCPQVTPHGFGGEEP